MLTLFILSNNWEIFNFIFTDAKILVHKSSLECTLSENNTLTKTHLVYVFFPWRNIYFFREFSNGYENDIKSVSILSWLYFTLSFLINILHSLLTFDFEYDIKEL